MWVFENWVLRKLFMRPELSSTVLGWYAPFGPYIPPVWGLSKSEMRRRGAEMLYELETAFREDGWPPDFVYDTNHDLYRFPDGEFAFSKEYANEKRLQEEGMIGWFYPRVRRVKIMPSRQASHRKGDGARCKGYCFHSGGKLANSKGDGARCNRSFDSRGPGQIPGALLF